MTDELFAPFHIHQPLTGEERQLIEALRVNEGGAQYLQALDEAGVQLLVPTDGAPCLGLERTDRAAIEQLIRKRLLPLAANLYQQGRYSYAYGSAALALRVAFAVLGAEHPHTLSSVNNLAVCLESLGYASEALPYFEWALETREWTLGRERPQTLTSVNVLAGCLRALGRASEALPYFERALDARERTLGREHPDTLTSSASGGVKMA